ncbi:MAG: DUF1559 domain-containing protein [Victivallales bacterium]|nr:DUF1559 domain-containing protein [Victivallales bacterium]
MKMKFWFGTAVLVIGSVCWGQTRELSDVELFDKVCTRLEKGGSYFNYQNNKYIFRAFTDTYAKLPAAIKAVVPDEQQQMLPLMIYSCLKPVVLSLGIDEILAGGASSVLIAEKTPTSPGLFRTRQFIYYGDSAPQGMIWGFASGDNHEFPLLKTLPPETLFACSYRSEPGILWTKIKAVFGKIPLPPLQNAGVLAEQSFLNKFQVQLPDLLESICGEYSLLVVDGTGKDGKPRISAMLTMPDKKGLAFSVIAEMLKSQLDTQVTENEIKISTGNQQNNLKNAVDFTVRKKDGKLHIMSHPEVMKILQAAASQNSGLKETAEFKYLAQQMPDKGIAFFYFSSRTFKALVDTVKAYAPPASIADIDWLALTALLPPADFFVVVSKEKDGILSVMNSPLDIPQLITYSSLMPSFIQMAALVPTMNKVHSKARSMSCRNQLKQIGLALKVYAMNHQDKFPVENNVAGFNELIKANGMKEMSVFICPNSGNVKAAAGELKEENCSYIYIGGFAEGDGAAVPMVFDKFDGNRKIINVLYQDGHVEAVPANFRNCCELIDYLAKINKYDEKILEKLKNKAAEIDKQMGLR